MTDPVQRLGITSNSQADLSPWLAALHDRLAPTPSEWALLTSLALVAVPLGITVWAPFGWVASAIVVLGQGAVVVTVGLRARRRHQRRLVDELPVVLEALARDLRTGATFRSAIERQATEGGALAPEFRRVHHAIELGRPLDDACAALAVSSNRLGEQQTMAGVLAMVSGGGRGSGRALDEAAMAARQHVVMQREVRALVAQAESSVRVLAGLPFVFVALAMLSGQAGASALVQSGIGRWCLAIGVGLDLAGLAWMRALVRSVNP